MSLQEILDVLDATPGLEESLGRWANFYEVKPPAGVEFVKCETELNPDTNESTHVKHIVIFRQDGREHKVRLDYQFYAGGILGNQ